MTTYLYNVLEDKDAPVVFHSPNLADEDPSFEEKQVSFAGLALRVSDREPVVSEEPAELVDVPSEPFNASNELIVCSPVRNPKEKF